MTLRKLALSLTLLGSVSLTQAADLLEVYRAARNYDAGYAAASAARDAEREKAPQARAGLLPSIGLAQRSGLVPFKISQRGLSNQLAVPGKCRSASSTASLRSWLRLGTRVPCS